MRWLLEWLLVGLGTAGEVRRLACMRDGVARVRRRIGYHLGCLEDLRRDFDGASRRVRLLELSEEADVSDLVEAHEGLLRARDAIGHHERKLEAAEAVHDLMRSDLLRLLDGLDPEHPAAYADELDG